MKAQVYHPESGKGFIRIVNRMSTKEIPLGYIRTPVVSPSACLRINQETSANRMVSLIGAYDIDAAGMVSADSGIASSLPLITAVFHDGVACFYRHRLQYPVHLKADANKWHPDAPVTVSGAESRIVAIPVVGQTELYWIDIYLTSSATGVYALYTARIDGIDVAYTRESLIPMPVSRAAALEDILQAVETEPLLAAEPISPTLTKAYVPLKPKPDNRERKNVQWRVEVMQGYTATSTYSYSTASLLPFEQITSADELAEGWLVVSLDPLTQFGLTLTAGQYMRVTVDEPSVEVSYHPQGVEPIKLRWRSGREPLDLPDQFSLVGGYFIPKVAVGAMDQGRPYVSVSGRSLDDPWHLQVHLGRETSVVSGTTYLYALPEYWRDLFSPIPPYSKQEEVPIRITEKVFRVRRTPIDLGVEVRAVIRGAVEIPLTVTEVDAEYGVIQTRESIPEGANLIVIYANRKDYVTYRGGAHYLDLNPRHLSILPVGYNWQAESGRRLVGETVYLYWLPYASLDELGAEVPLREETLVHSLTPMTDATAILLATIEPTIPFGPASLGVLDARRRGGGLPENYVVPLEREADAAALADIGHFDGMEVPLSGSYVIEIAPWIPVNDPGQVRQVAEQVGPFGQLPLVQTVEWPEQILLPPMGLWIDIVEVQS